MGRSEDKQKTDGTTSSTTTTTVPSSSSSSSCVVEIENKLIANETVMVNNFVNIETSSSNANTINTCEIDESNEGLMSGECQAAEILLLEETQQSETNLPPFTSSSAATTASSSCASIAFNSEHYSSCSDIAREDSKEMMMMNNNNNIDNDDDNKSNSLRNDQDTLNSSSNYVDVSSRCEILLQPSTSTSALSQHAASNLYTPTRDKNRSHRKAVRKNFSLWIGVTSCVWACLVLLLKNYSD
jgi:hypothetical protein